MRTSFADARLRISILKRMFSHGIIGTVLWSIKGGGVPTPNFIKWRTIKNRFHQDAVCVETGTYLGETTKWLSKNYGMVLSIEPQKKLFDFNARQFSENTKVRIFQGTSEEKFRDVLSQIENKSNINFWLDGHFSGGITHKGIVHSPIVQELECIKRELKRFGKDVIAIDDFRDFRMQESNGYADRNWLVKWANENQCSWDVRNDIFFIEKSKV